MLGLGVVVAGLGIGALLSAVQHRERTTTVTSTTTGIPAVTPVARPTRGPVVVATMVTHPTPTPIPTATPTPVPTATPLPTPARTAAPAVMTAPAVTAAPATEAPQPTATPPATRPPTTRPTPAVAVTTPRPPTPPPVVARVTEPPPTGFGGQAQSTVRRYLDALIAGNENTAYAALGAVPGDTNVELSEEAFIDRGTRITSLRTTRVDPTGATVEAEIVSSRGSYFATYHVTSGPAGPVIDQHDYIKV